MSNINKIINQLSRAEGFIQEDVDMQLTVKNVLESYAALPVIQHRMAFPPTEVPIATFEEGTAPTQYGVAADVFGLFMERNSLRDIKESLDIIATQNGLDSKNISLVFESGNSITDMIEEAKKETHIGRRNAKLQSVSRMGYLIDNLKTGNVSVCKEPNPVSQVDFNDTNIITIDTTKPFGDGFDDPKRNPRKE